MKAIAAELDWSPSQLSMATTLGDDNARPFPADDAHLVKLCRVTGDHSVLYTLADLLGYEVQPRADTTPKLLSELQTELRALMPKFQMVLDLGAAAPLASVGKTARR
jgi:hypothetical protein